MEGVDLNVVTSALTTILSVFHQGAGRLAGAGAGLLGTLVAIEMVWAGVLWSLQPDMAPVLTSFLKRVVKVGIFSLLVLNFPEIANVVLDGFIWAGGQVGGANEAISLMRNPSKIIELGFTTVADAWVNTSFGEVGVISAISGGGAGSVVEDLLAIVLSLIALAMYWLIAMQAFLCVLEFYVAAAFGAIFMPFGINQHTKWIAEKYMGAIMAQGAKLMVLTALIGVIAPILHGLKLPENSGFEHFLVLVIGVASLALIVWRVPQMASAMMNGQASLSAQTPVMVAAGMGASSAKTMGAGAVQNTAAMATRGGQAALKGAGVLASAGVGLGAGAAAGLALQEGSARMAQTAREPLSSGGQSGGMHSESAPSVAPSEVAPASPTKSAGAAVGQGPSQSSGGASPARTGQGGAARTLIEAPVESTPWESGDGS